MKRSESANSAPDHHAFCSLWPILEAGVEKAIHRCLRNRLVFDQRGRVDGVAADDIRQEVAVKVMRLCEGGKFRANGSQKPCLSAAKGYVAKIVEHETVNYCRTYRNSRRKTKVHSITGIEFNAPGEGAGILEREPARVTRESLWNMIKEGINELPGPQAELVRLKYEDGLSERQAAKVVGISAASVNRRLKKAYGKLQVILNAKGIEL